MLAGDAARPHHHAALFADVHAGTGSACWPHAGSFTRAFAEASQLCRRSAGCCGTLWERLVSGRPPAPQSNPRSAAVLTYIHQNELENKTVLVPQADLPTLHYYFPGMRLRGYFGREPAIAERTDFEADATIAAAEP